jgi:hypothetical protein
MALREGGFDVTILAMSGRSRRHIDAMRLLWGLWVVLIVGGMAFAQADDAPLKDDEEDKPLKMKLGDAVFLSVSNGKLIADSKLKGARLVDQAVEIEDLGGTSSLTLKPEFLRFENTRAVSDGIETLRIENRNDVVRVERSGREATVYYRESSGGFGNFGNDGVRMSVYGPDGTMLHSLTANDFEAMRRENRAQVYQYLGPILRLLKTDGIIGADPRMARQVLRVRQPENQLEPAVKKLVIQLDSESFKDRDTALAKLKSFGPDAVAIVERMDHKKLSPQQRTGIEAFVSDVKLVSLEELDRLGRDPQFLLECLYCEEAALRAAALERLRKINRDPIAFDAKSDPLAQAGVIEELRAKLVPPPATAPAAAEQKPSLP